MTFEVERTEVATHARIGVHKFEMPFIDDAQLDSEPVALFMSAMTLTDSTLTSLEAALADPMLSALARAEG